MSRLVTATLALHRALQRLRSADVRRRFDDEERLVLADELIRRRSERGRLAVLRVWPVLLRDGLADMVTTRRVSRRDTLTRRAGDLLVAGLGALPAAVLLGGLAALVRLSMGAPAFVDVTYQGRGGRPLRLRKLRTMTATGRVTTLGRVLRATRLDELPSVFALLRGEVTLFGPLASRDRAAAGRPGLIGSRHPSRNPRGW